MDTAFVRTAEARLGEILVRRLRPAASAVSGSLAFAAAVLFALGSTRAGSVACLGALLGAAIGIVASRIPAARAASTHVALYWLVGASICTASQVVAPWVVDAWFGLLCLGYGMTQLDTRYFYVNAGVGVLVWSALVLAQSPDTATSGVRVITVLASASTAWLVFVMLRRYVVHIEFLRASDARHQEELTVALEQARTELMERRRLEAERETMMARAVASQRLEAMGQMAGGVAHELNNILAGILGIACLLRDSSARDFDLDDLEAIIAACRRGGDLTHALLKFGRTSASNVGVIELSELLREVEPMLRQTTPAGATLSFTCPPQPTLATANRADLAQTVVNLCLNAFDAGATRVHLTVAPHKEGETDWIEITVEDDGAGMPAEVRARAFEPFFTTKARGTGLGLAQVYGTARSVGGSVEIASTPGAGTTVRLRLPAATVREVARPSSAPKPRSCHRDCDILVADDEPLVRNVMSRLLSRAGFQVVTARDGLEAVECAAQRSFDLAVLDMAMPDLDGLETFLRLKGRNPRLRALIVSGHADDTLAERALAAGVSEVLLKPLDPSTLLSAVSRLVDAQSSLSSQSPT